MSRDTWRRVWLSIEWLNSSWKGGERLPPSVPLKGYPGGVHNVVWLWPIWLLCILCILCGYCCLCLLEHKATVFGEEMSLPKIFRACGAQTEAKNVFAGLRPAPLRPPSRKIMTARPGPPVAAPGTSEEFYARSTAGGPSQRGRLRGGSEEGPSEKWLTQPLQASQSQKVDPSE